MRLRFAVVTCNAYLDAVGPFLSLLDKFWPDHPPVWLVTDEIPTRAIEQRCHGGVFVYPGKGPQTWSARLALFANTCHAPVLIFQEDMFLNAPVNTELIEHGLEQMHARNAGSCRLYPCPGSDAEYGDPHFGLVTPHTRYRNSLQATIWRPSYLYAIASQCDTPAHFEITGSQYASIYLKDEVLAFKRESGAPPLSYLCSAISRSQWNPDAKKLCDSLGIVADWTRRPFASTVNA